MPHQCTNCGRAFADGSKEMLSGCPDCGGNKFQFHPGESVPADPEPTAEPPEPPTADSSVARTVGSAAATVRDLVGSGTSSDAAGAPEPVADDTGSSPAGPAEGGTVAEDTAQADARSEVVNPEEIPSSTDDDWTPAAGSAAVGDDTASTPASDSNGDTPASPDSPAATPDRADPAAPETEPDRPDLAELREELNDQFESIKVLKPGQYELNLMELYDREEYIIALQEDGRYTIQVPETWHD